MNFIQPQLEQPFAGKTIVVTHHMPTFMNYPPKFKGDILNEAFAVELHDYIEQTQPHYWIYGHIHANAMDFKIGKTQLLSNQLGYVRHGENTHFLNDVVFEV
jgi:Icc-related predicted phosphoesterase